jgi:integrase
MIVQYNAAARATPPKLPQYEAETFQPEDVTAIRDALEREPLKWRMFTHLLLVSGCRRGEIAGLTWDKVDWDNSQIKVDAASLYSMTKGVYEDTTKTSTTRFVKLPAETMQMLREYRAWYAELQIRNGDRWQKSGNVFVQDNGKPMHPDSITDWLAKFSERHSLPHVNPHKFRHTHASLLYFGGMDSISISKRLGHAKVSTTTDIYSHIIKQADEKAAECIADAILRKPSAG